MDIHPPQRSVHSLKDFLFHLLTVTIGILIALSLEGLLEWRHHRALVEEARTNLALEIRENRELLERGLASAPDAEQRLSATIEAVETNRKNRNSRASNLNWGFGIFSLNTTAWQTAASTGAVSYMDYSEVRRYTRVYGLQEQFMSLQQRTLDKWLDHQKWLGRMNPQDGLSKLSNEEISKVEDEASAALIYTQTEESIARSLADEYARVLQEK